MALQAVLHASHMPESHPLQDCFLHGMHCRARATQPSTGDSHDYVFHQLTQSLYDSYMSCCGEKQLHSRIVTSCWPIACVLVDLARHARSTTSRRWRQVRQYCDSLPYLSCALLSRTGIRELGAKLS
eukprot:4991184-Amphidinium_carterae.1